MEAISIGESKRLIVLEKAIEAGKKTFVEVGMALSEIRDSKLYKSDFKTFEDYCRERWGWSRIQSHRLIEAAEVTEMLPVGNKPENERQARELAKVEPEKRVEAIEKAKAVAAEEERPMTAKDIREAAAPKPDPKPDTQSYRISVEVLKQDIRRYIQHRPLKRAQLATCSKILHRAALRFKSFAKKAKE